MDWHPTSSCQHSVQIPSDTQKRLQSCNGAAPNFQREDLTDKSYGKNEQVVRKSNGSWKQQFPFGNQNIHKHAPTCLNYFRRRATNASAEAFNSKVKIFRSQMRGIRDRDFFIFRHVKLYAWFLTFPHPLILTNAPEIWLVPIKLVTDFVVVHS